MDSQNTVQVELPREVLCRLLRHKNIVASEIRGLNDSSRRATWHAVKNSVCTRRK